MQKVDNPEQFREKVIERILIKLKDCKITTKNFEKLARNLEKGVYNFLIHDCMCYNGTNFLNFTHNLRYACIIDFILKRYNPKQTDCFNVKTKLFYKYGPGLDITWKHIQKTTENKIDGLIFTPVNGPIVFGRDNELLKWKEKHTMDFFVKKETKKINLYFQKKSKLELYTTISKENEKLLKNFVSQDQLKEGLIIEFEYNDDLFIPYRVRTDKKKPNGEITIKNTMINIEEGITIEMLCKKEKVEPELNMDSLKINNS